MRYFDGQEAHVGDTISIDAGRHTGMVELIIETFQDIAAFGVCEPGLSVISDTYGRVFIGQEEIHDDEVSLLSRNSA